MRVFLASLLGWLLTTRAQETLNIDNVSSLEGIDGIDYNALDVSDRELYGDIVPQYVGCFKDVVEDRGLPFRAGRNMSFGDCAYKCVSYGFRYFGRQSAGECWCGVRKESDGLDSYAKHGPADECDCDNWLVGKHKQCVYDIGHDLPHRLGCWKDNADKRALPFYMGRGIDFDECQEKCVSIGAPVFGMQAREECWCGAGKLYRRYGESEECMCGTRNLGKYVNCVYMMNDFQGCWQDTADRALEVKVGRPYGRIGCTKACRELGRHFMGRQARHECWCGGSTPEDYTWQKHGPSDNCNCESKSNIGSWSMCVHRVWYATLRGCFADAEERALPHYVERGMDWESCHEACKAKGFYLMGLQAHGECRCGGSSFEDESYNMHGPAEGCKCHKDAKYVGAWKQCVWRIPQADTVPQSST